MQNSLGNVASTEIQLFAYLSCLLSLYKGQQASAWGYDFAITKLSYPYSPELDQAIDVLVSNGCLKLSNEYITVTEFGKEEYTFLKSLFQFSTREDFIDGACSSLLALPVGAIRNALYQETDIKGAVALAQSRLLLTESGVDALYEQFGALSTSIGVEVDDLMVPAVVWLSYLLKVQNLND